MGCAYTQGIYTSGHVCPLRECVRAAFDNDGVRCLQLMGVRDMVATALVSSGVPEEAAGAGACCHVSRSSFYQRPSMRTCSAGNKVLLHPLF